MWTKKYVSLEYVLFLLLVMVLLPRTTQARRRPVPTFSDVTREAGIDSSIGRLKKYGGPTIVDLDDDGQMDLMFCHHDKYFMEIYFNNGDGTFQKHPFKLWRDMHGIIAGPTSSRSRNLRFTVSVGGNFGLTPASPLMYEVDHRTRGITEVTKKAGINGLGGRGRSAVFMNLAGRGKHVGLPDILFTNAGVVNEKRAQQFAYENVGNGKYKARYLAGYANNRNWYATVADVNGDGMMEVISYQNFSVFQVDGAFKLKDITNRVLGDGDIARNGVVAIAEVDYDNDGDFDLYVARTKSGDLSWVGGNSFDDLLLENRNGQYVDVSAKAGLIKNGISRGVTTGDFNNDGCIDIFVTHYQTADVLLQNNCDGTFERVYGRVDRPGNVRGDMAAAVDYDSDGLVDLVVGQGDAHIERLGGRFRIFKNVMKHKKGHGRFISVRVGNAPNRGATGLHAVVKVVSGNLKMMRRVGSPGTQVSSSYMDILHFGLGKRGMVNSISVRWSNGYTSVKRNIKHASTTFFGVA